MVLWELQVEVEVDLWGRKLFNILKRFQNTCTIFDIVLERVCDVVGIGLDVVEYGFEAVLYLVYGRGEVGWAFGCDFCAGLACEVAFCACDGDGCVAWRAVKRANWLICFVSRQLFFFFFLFPIFSPSCSKLRKNISTHYLKIVKPSRPTEKEVELSNKTSVPFLFTMASRLRISSMVSSEDFPGRFLTTRAEDATCENRV